MSQNKLEFMVKEIMKRFPECSYNINKSQKSDSLYLYITDGYLKRTLRLSDHWNNYNYQFSTEIVADKVRENWLYGAIVNLCKSMKRSRTKYLFRVVSKQLAQAN